MEELKDMLGETIKTGPYAHMTFEQKFLSSYLKPAEGCWEWQRKLYPNGYGYFWVKGRELLAHRVSYMLSTGNFNLLPRDVVMHSCDNRRCVNPAHLSVGTARDNMQDAVRKGRMNPPRGVRSGRAIFTEGDICSIRALARLGWTRQRIGRLFNTNYQTVGKIMDNQRWQHVEGIGMDADTYAKLAIRTANDMGSRELNLVHAAMGIAGESGEILDLVKKVFAYGKPVDRSKLLEEVSDVLWYVSLLLGILGSSFGEVFDMNVKKLEKRYPNLRFEAEHAINRDVEAEQDAMKAGAIA